MSDAARQNPQVLVGSTLADSYVLDRLLDSGRHGALFDGRHVRTGSRTAVRIIWCDSARRSLLRKALVAQSSLIHPHLVPPREFIVLPDESLLVATPFLPGQDLAQRQAARGKLSVNEGQVVVRQIAAALQALHLQGLCHGNLSPGNIFFTRFDDVTVDSPISDGKGGQVVQLLDAGLAVLDGGTATAADDVRALGRLMQSAMVDLSGAQRQVLERSQEARKEASFASVAAFWRAWSDAAGGGRQGRSAATSVMPKFDLSRGDPEARDRRPLIVLGAALLGLLLVGVVILLRPRRPPALPPSLPPIERPAASAPPPAAAKSVSPAPSEPSDGQPRKRKKHAKGR